MPSLEPIALSMGDLGSPIPSMREPRTTSSAMNQYQRPETVRPATSLTSTLEAVLSPTLVSSAFKWRVVVFLRRVVDFFNTNYFLYFE